jgi:hypothetical protein
VVENKIISLEERIAEAVPGFVVKKTLMVLPPVDQVLRGVWFDRSAYDEISFSVTAFVLPLCAPTKNLYFNFGERIRNRAGGDRWSIGMPDLCSDLVEAMKLRATPFFARTKDLEGFIEFAQLSPKTARSLEALGYSLARVGNVHAAREAFEQILPMINPAVAWQRELAEQVEAFSKLLSEHPDDAMDQLSRYEEQTVRNLNLEAFRGASAQRKPAEF